METLPDLNGWPAHLCTTLNKLHKADAAAADARLAEKKWQLDRFAQALTYEEQELLAYIAGDTERAALLEQALLLECIPTDAGDAFSGYPDEGFLEEHISELRRIAKNMRGDNRKGLEEQIGELEGLQGEMVRSAEYGREELRKFQQQLEDATS